MRFHVRINDEVSFCVRTIAVAIVVCAIHFGNVRWGRILVRRNWRGNSALCNGLPEDSIGSHLAFKRLASGLRSARFNGRVADRVAFRFQ